MRRYAEAGDRSKLSVATLRRLDAILEALDTAQQPQQMNVAGWRFHPLKGEMKGRYAVDASGN